MYVCMYTLYTGHYRVHCMIVKTNKTNPQAEFLCAVDHSCMVSSIKWFHATPDNLTITLIKVDDNHDNQDHDHLVPQTAASPGDPHVHLIPSVLPSHSGTYSCVAENVLGQVRHHPLTTCVHCAVADDADDADDAADDADDADKKMATHLILGQDR